MADGLQPHPPYEILQNKLIDFSAMQKLRRFARYWDLIGNSGNFMASTPLIWGAASPFHSFLRLSEWLHTRTGRTDGIALTRLMELLFEFLTVELRLDARRVAEALWHDYRRGGRHDRPGFLGDYLSTDETVIPLRKTKSALPKRQAHHLA